MAERKQRSKTLKKEETIHLEPTITSGIYFIDSPNGAFNAIGIYGFPQVIDYAKASHESLIEAIRTRPELNKIVGFYRRVNLNVEATTAHGRRTNLFGSIDEPRIYVSDGEIKDTTDNRGKNVQVLIHEGQEYPFNSAMGDRVVPRTPQNQN